MKTRHVTGIAAALFLMVISVIAGPNWPGDTLVISNSPSRASTAPAIGAHSISAGVALPAASLARVKSFASVVPAPPAAAPPNAPVNFAPNDGATGVSSPTTLDVSVSDPAGSNMTVTFFGRPATTPGADFNLIVLPDTQYYSSTMNGGTPAMFYAQAQWIVNNKTTMNIPYVTSVGDVVQTGDNDGNNTEWIVADTAYKILEAAGIPFGVVPGNHDEGNNLSNLGSASITDAYNNWFGVSRFTGRSYYGGHPGTGNDNHYDLFSASGMDFIALHFAYDESPSGTRFQNVLTWANGILKQYPARRAILVSHFILNNGNPATFGPQGQTLFNALSNNPNLFLTLSGHIGFPGEGQRSDTVSGNVIQSVMSDFQDRANGGGGWLRIMTFSPANNSISVKTFSPVLNQNMTDVGSQFTLPYNMQNNGYAMLGTVSGVLSGAHAQATWNGLNSNSPYQWYVTVNNGTSTTTGPVWSLTTAGTGVPAVNLSSNSLNFNNQATNTNSVPQNVTLGNTGSAPLTISSIGISGQYTHSNNCGAGVAAGASCMITVTFSPTAAGTQTGTVSINDNAGGSPHTISLTGVGTTPAPVASLSVPSLNFGNQLVNTPSAPQSVTLTNTGTGPMTISGIVASAQYSQTNTCPTGAATLAANGSCSITVTFTPTATGAQNGTVQITDNAAGSPQSVSLTGTGATSVIAGASPSPTGLTFASQNTGTTSAPQTITLTNTGNGTLSITSIVPSGDFAQSNNCGASLLAGASCTINVTFTPTATGARSGAITFTDNAPNSPQAAGLTGTGTASAIKYIQSASASSTSASSLAKAFTSATTQNNLLVVGVYTWGGTVSSITDTLANSYILATSASTASGNNLYVYYAINKATGANTVTAHLSGGGVMEDIHEYSGISTTAPLDQKKVSLGTGTAINSGSVATLVPDELIFGFAAVDGNSVTGAGATFTLRQNTGSGELSEDKIVATTGSYSATATCPSTTWAGAIVTFAGAGTTPNVSLSSSSLTFASQPLNVPSAAQNVTLTNTGGATLNISNIGLAGANTGDYGYTTTCGSTVAASGNCTFSVTFTPTASGARTASVSITDDAGGSPQAISLTGTGASAPAPAVSLAPPSLTFASQTLNTTSGSQSVTLTNSGNAALTISSIAASAQYGQTNNCPASPATLAAAGTCTISVSFTPTATGTQTGSVTITDNASGSPHAIGLTGTGAGAPAPAVLLSPTGLTFVSQTINTTSGPQSVTLTNTGNAALTITSIAVSAQYGQTNNCPVSPATLAAAGTCTINVTFTPTATGTQTGSISIGDNASGSPHSITLSGTGATAGAPAVTLTPTSLSYPSRTVGTTSSAKTVTLKNTGTGTLTITSIATSGDFSQTNTCGTSRTAGQSCTISVRFKPTAKGTRTGTLTVIDNATGSPHTASLTGTGR
jgi:hypothetical protein